LVVLPVSPALPRCASYQKRMAAAARTVIGNRGPCQDSISGRGQDAKTCPRLSPAPTSSSRPRPRACIIS
jgi:hypothetical protein